MKRRKNGNIIWIWVLIILLIFFIGFLLFNVISQKLDVTIENGQINQKFNSEIYEYNIYSNNNEITINCNRKMDGCNIKIKVEKNKIIHKIIFKGKVYTFNINKIEATGNKEEIKILEVNGNPKEWKKEATIEAIIFNPNKEYIEYSFDNGNTWIKDAYKKVIKNGIYKIKIRDKDKKVLDSKEIQINNVDSIAPIVKISKKKINNKEIELSLVTSDSLSGIKKFKWNTKEEKEKIIVKKNGNYSVEVIDNAGNINTANIQVNEIGNNEEVENTYVVIFDNNGSDNESITKTCTTKTDSCTIIAPEIVRNGYIILGWSENKDSHTNEINVNEEIVVNKNKKYYAITKKELNATFDKNGADNISQVSIKCYKFNNESSCSIKLPSITRNGYTIHGWSTNKNATNGIQVNTNVSIISNTKYYAITSKEIVVSFDKNNNYGQTPANGNTTTAQIIKESCTIFNANTKCSITSPKIIPYNNSMTVLGYSLGSTTYSDYWLVNTSKDFSNNKTYYAQAKEDITVTFNKNGADSISYNNKTCSKHNNESSCKVKTPTISRKGFTIIGWSTDSNASSGVSVNSNIAVSSNTTYYALTSKEVTITFNKNGNTSQTLPNGTTSSSNEVNQKCTIRNSQTKCSITPPTINMSGYLIHGYSTGSTTYSNYWKDTPKEFNTDLKYYAQTSKTITVTFDKNTTFDNNTVPKTSSSYDYTKTNIAASSLSFYSKTCLSRNNSGCKITEPPVINSPGNEVNGFSKTYNGSTVSVYSQLNKNDTTYYARIYNQKTNGVQFNYANNQRLGNTNIEIDSDITASIRSQYVSFITNMYNTLPHLFDSYSKLLVMTSSFFDLHTGWSGYGGMTSGSVEYPYVGINVYSSTNKLNGYSLYTIGHELGHVFDRTYSKYNSKRISAESDFESVYEFCKTDSNKCGFKTHVTYIMKSANEFFAESVAAYYASIAFQDKCYPNGGVCFNTIDSRVVSIIEKYMCIANHNYNKNANC